eukprot:230327-Ditylum_brightwellii.AAC.1
MNAWWGEESDTMYGTGSSSLNTINQDSHADDSLNDNEDDYNLDHYDARENMVRGCCGLDVTSLSETYSTVNSIGIVDNFSKQKNGILHDDKETQSVSKSLASSLTASAREPQKKRHDEDKIWERLFSLFRLQTVLRDILSEEHNNGNQEEIDGRYTASNPTFRGEGDDQKCDDDL